MNRPHSLASLALGLSLPAAAVAQPAVTVYNDNFGVVRDRVTIELARGVAEVRIGDLPAHVEPDSVILRDPTGQRAMQILEQNYRSDPLSQELLLSLFEGQEIEFLVAADKPPIRGRIVRSGYVPHTSAWERYGQQYMYAQARYMDPTASGAPIIEIDGKLRFGLPGTPLFPSLSDDTVLRPTLTWRIEADRDGPLEAELAYVTGGMSWKADYNVVAPQQGETLDVNAWVTIDNQCGRAFENATIKLMAGDVNKLAPDAFMMDARSRRAMESLAFGGAAGMTPPVTQKSFDEYHLYTLKSPTTLRDRQTKQVELLRASGVASKRVYVYDGIESDWQRYQGWALEDRRNHPDYGTRCNRKVWVMREMHNTGENHLGVPLPAGRVRFYKTDDDGRLEFVGENDIDHTPKDELLRIYTGNAFDLVGERVRKHFEINHEQRWINESFEVRLRNHRDQVASVRVVEHTYRWHTWSVTEKSLEFTKKDSQTIEFGAEVPADSETTITYSVRYTW